MGKIMNLLTYRKEQNRCTAKSPYNNWQCYREDKHRGQHHAVATGEMAKNYTDNVWK